MSQKRKEVNGDLGGVRIKVSDPAGAQPQSRCRQDQVIHDDGHIHIGTALNKILKDIAIKSQTLAGYDAPYIPG